MAVAMFYMFGPESMGGRGNFRVKAEEESKRSGRTFKEVALEVGPRVLVVLHAFQVQALTLCPNRSHFIRRER